MHLRNAIIVLEKISECFPIISWMGRALKDKISFIVAQEKREDLKVRALGYRAKLIKGEIKWMSINQFQKVLFIIFKLVYLIQCLDRYFPRT